MILPVWAAREKAQPIVKSVSLATTSRTASVQVSELCAEEGELSRRNIFLVKGAFEGGNLSASGRCLIVGSAPAQTVLYLL